MSVLWAVLLVAGLSALFVNVIGMHLRSAAAFNRHAEAEVAAEGAIRLFAYRLAWEPQQGTASRLPRDGDWFSCRLFDDLTARIAIQDQDGLIDINQAPMPLMRRVMDALQDREQAGRLLSAIEARREEFIAGRKHSENGMELDEFGSFLRSAPFQRLDEVAAVLPDRVDRQGLLALLTVHSQSDGFDASVAPAVLLQLVAANGDAMPEDIRPSRSRMFSITAAVGTPQTGRSVRRAMVELLRSPERPFRLEWERSSGTALPEPDPGKTDQVGPAC